MTREDLNREKEQAYYKGYEDGAEKCREFFREQFKRVQMEAEKAFHEGYMLGKNEDEMDKVFGGIEAIKPRENDDK